MSAMKSAIRYMGVAAIVLCGSVSAQGRGGSADAPPPPRPMVTAPAPVAAPRPLSATSAADALYCGSVFKEAQASLKAEGDEAAAGYAMGRDLALAYFAAGLQESKPAAFEAARKDADQRFAALPSGAGRAKALRAAFDACYAREGGNAPPSAVAQLMAEQKFCKNLFADVSAVLTEAPETLTPDSTAVYSDFARIARELDGPGVAFRTDTTQIDERQASDLLKQKNADLDARLKAGSNDEVLSNAVADCYEEYRGGKLGLAVK